MIFNKLKIAIIADPFIPVPPMGYGGIERIIDMLINEYFKIGHEVVLIAHPDSKTKGQLISYSNQNTKLKHLKNIITINKLKVFKPDIIHSFGRLAYLLPVLSSSTPKLMSYQREPTIKQIKKTLMLVKKNSLTFTGCSAYISDKIKPYAQAHPIFNGVDLSTYQFNEAILANAPLVFLGRIDPEKGAHLAIEIAIKTNKKLIIAGNIPPASQIYFDTQIAPFLNKNIIYVGSMNDPQKNQLLGSALALLMPIEWDEPFGIVMAESMACGTPVIALNKGSVPEVVVNNVNGYRCDNVIQMVDAVLKVENIDRKLIRKDAENRFSATEIAKQYLELYQQLINQN